MSQNQDDFTKLVNQYSTMLYRYAYWLSGSPSVAQDLVQETYLRAWKAFDSLQNKENPKYWLITILRRENARRFERKRLLQVQKEVDTLESHYGAIDSSPETFALRQALGKLSEEYREPLLLQVICGYSGKEIADLLGLTPEAVMTRLYRARQRLQDVLQPEESPTTKRPKP